MTRAIALVPARAGSSRVPDKNVHVLAGHPMLAYTIAAARDAGVFDTVVVSTDSERYATIARHYGAEVPGLRAAELATDDSPDIAWVSDLLAALEADGRTFDVFSILRPTSPLRSAKVIADAMRRFLESRVDSLRAVEPVAQHPGKMWVVEGDRMVPLLPGEIDGVPWHSRPTQSLPRIWVQNASLEIAWTRCVRDHGTISGEAVLPFVSPPPAGLDVNTPEDLARLERLVAEQPALLPRVDAPAFDDHRSP